MEDENKTLTPPCASFLLPLISHALSHQSSYVTGVDWVCSHCLHWCICVGTVHLSAQSLHMHYVLWYLLLSVMFWFPLSSIQPQTLCWTCTFLLSLLEPISPSLNFTFFLEMHLVRPPVLVQSGLAAPSVCCPDSHPGRPSLIPPGNPFTWKGLSRLPSSFLDLLFSFWNFACL